MSPFDLVSAIQRLASSGKLFASAPEYAEAISRGQAGEFMDVLMATLGNATTMRVEETCAIAELYMND